MFQDIFPHLYHVEFQPGAIPQPEDLLLIYRDGGVLAGKDGLSLPARRDFPELSWGYAFSVDSIRVFLSLEAPEETEHWHYLPSGSYREMEPRELAFVCGVGESLNRWYRANRYCGCCGREMTPSEKERALVCTCGNVVYPRINPAVIVAITDGDRLLLTKYAGRAFRRYALVAGFCEIGESVEDTVRREVYEEVGLRVKDLRFYKSQPWVFTDSLLMGFYCTVDGSTEPVLRDGELSLAQWFSREELPEDHSHISLTGEMIDRFRLGEF